MISVPPVLPRTLVLEVNEFFGPTVQGEGPHAGRRAVFLRLARCNLACSWCDTPYTWDWENHDRGAEIHAHTPAEVAAWVLQAGVDLLVVTGGEPMMQQPALQALRDELLGWSGHIEVETNGTIGPRFEGVVDLYVVSPKLSNSGDPERKRLKAAALSSYVRLAREGRAIFKFVVGAGTLGSDLAEIEALVASMDVAKAHVWVMPLGASRREHLANLAAVADPVLKAGYNLTTRLHVLAWDTERRR